MRKYTLNIQLGGDNASWFETLVNTNGTNKAKLIVKKLMEIDNKTKFYFKRINAYVEITNGNINFQQDIPETIYCTNNNSHHVPIFISITKNNNTTISYITEINSNLSNKYCRFNGSKIDAKFELFCIKTYEPDPLIPSWQVSDTDKYYKYYIPTEIISLFGNIINLLESIQNPYSSLVPNSSAKIPVVYKRVNDTNQFIKINSNFQ